MPVKNGNAVKIHYKGTLEDGEVFDSSEGREPLEFTIGAKMVIPGFEEGVVGMEKGEKKTLNIKAADAYGNPRDELVQDVPKENLPEGVQEGMTLGVGLPGGQQIPAKVVKVTEEGAKLDMNHPLAGKDLTFEVELVDYGEGKPPEKQGCCGGHDHDKKDDCCDGDCDCKDSKKPNASKDEE